MLPLCFLSYETQNFSNVIFFILIKTKKHPNRPFLSLTWPFCIAMPFAAKSNLTTKCCPQQMLLWVQTRANLMCRFLFQTKKTLLKHHFFFQTKNWPFIDVIVWNVNWMKNIEFFHYLLDLIFISSYSNR